MLTKKGLSLQWRFLVSLTGMIILIIILMTLLLAGGITLLH